MNLIQYGNPLNAPHYTINRDCICCVYLYCKSKWQWSFTIFLRFSVYSSVWIGYFACITMHKKVHWIFIENEFCYEFCVTDIVLQKQLNTFVWNEESFLSCWSENCSSHKLEKYGKKTLEFFMNPAVYMDIRFLIRITPHCTWSVCELKKSLLLPNEKVVHVMPFGNNKQRKLHENQIKLHCLYQLQYLVIYIEFIKAENDTRIAGIPKAENLYHRDAPWAPHAFDVAHSLNFESIQYIRTGKLFEIHAIRYVESMCGAWVQLAEFVIMLHNIDNYTSKPYSPNIICNYRNFQYFNIFCVSIFSLVSLIQKKRGDAFRSKKWFNCST